MQKVQVALGGLTLAVGLLALFTPAQAQTSPPSPLRPPRIRSIDNSKPTEDFTPDPTAVALRADARRLYAQGQKLYVKGQLKEAAEAYLKALALDDLVGAVRDSLADVYLDMGESEKAVEALRPAVAFTNEETGKTSLVATNPVTLFKFALALKLAGCNEDAVEVYHRGLRYLFASKYRPELVVVPPRFDTPDGTQLSLLYSPQHLEAMIRLGWGVAEGAGQLSYKQRLEQIDKAVSLWPRSAAAYYWRANVTLYNVYAPAKTPEMFARAKADLERAASFSDKQAKGLSDSFLKRLE